MASAPEASAPAETAENAGHPENSHP
jgi:hypothetical protein